MIKLASIIFKVGGVVLLGATVGVFSHWRYTAGKESANTHPITHKSPLVNFSLSATKFEQKR